jgi:hypothetical protein
LVKLLIKLLLCLSLWSCSQTDNQTVVEYPVMEINVDYNLLSQIPIQINNLEFNISKEWGSVNSNQLNSLKNIFIQDSLMNVFKLVHGQTNGSTLLLVGKSEITNRTRILSNFSNKLEKTFSKKSIHLNKFRINDVKVDQFIATNATHTSFHLFIELDNLYLIEFLIPLETYEKQIQIIESTIGTIKKRKKKNENNI